MDVLRSVQACHRETSLLQLQPTSYNYTTSCRLGNIFLARHHLRVNTRESNTHVQALLPTGRLSKIACGGTTSFGHGSQWRTISKVKNTNGPHSLCEEQDSTQCNSLMVIGIFCFKACDPRARLPLTASGADDYG